MFEQQYAMTMLDYYDHHECLSWYCNGRRIYSRRIRNVACFLRNVWYDLEV